MLPLDALVIEIIVRLEEMLERPVTTVHWDDERVPLLDDLFIVHHAEIKSRIFVIFRGVFRLGFKLFAIHFC